MAIKPVHPISFRSQDNAPGHFDHQAQRLATQVERQSMLNRESAELEQIRGRWPHQVG